MRTLKLWQFLTVCSVLAAAPMLAHSQAAAAAPASAPKSAPPDMQKLEEGDAPPVTIRKPDGGSKTTEKREQGVVTDVEVQSGKSHYHLKQSPGPGNAAPGDAQSNSLRPAQWQIKQFDWGRKKKHGKQDAAPEDKPADDLQAPAPLPPPPAASAPAKK